MAWDEWEHAKAGAASAQPVHMQLNQHAPGGGGGTQGGGNPGGGGHAPTAADLAINGDDIGELGHIAYELRLRLMPAGDHAKAASAEASRHLYQDGLHALAEALDQCDRAWDRQVNSLEVGCAYLSNGFDFTRASHAKNDEQIGISMLTVTGDRLTASALYNFIK